MGQQLARLLYTVVLTAGAGAVVVFIVVIAWLPNCVELFVCSVWRGLHTVASSRPAAAQPIINQFPDKRLLWGS